VEFKELFDEFQVACATYILNYKGETPRKDDIREVVKKLNSEMNEEEFNRVFRNTYKSGLIRVAELENEKTPLFEVSPVSKDVIEEVMEVIGYLEVKKEMKKEARLLVDV